MPVTLLPTGAIMGVCRVTDVAIFADGRCSRGTLGFVIGHITPEAHVCGTPALVDGGDAIAIHAANHTITFGIRDT